MLTDVTQGSAGNNERLGFLFDTRRVKPSGLACELVVPLDATGKISENAFDRQFARTPYAVSFACAGQTIVLVTLHIDYGSQPADRAPELEVPRCSRTMTRMGSDPKGGTGNGSEVPQVQS